jgi:hypothetical protein
LSFAEKQTNCQAFSGIGHTLIFEVSLLQAKQGLQNAKKLVRNRTSPFAHEAGHCLCGAWVIAVKENSRRRRTRAQYPKKQEEKDFTHSLGALPLL